MPDLCVVRDDTIRLTETFIRAHIERLPARVSVIQALPPRLDVGGAPRAVPVPLGRRIVRRIRRRLDGPPGLEDHWTEDYTRLLEAADADVVLAEYGTTGVRVREACRRLDVPLVVHFHGFDAYRDTLLAEFGDAYRRLFADAAALVAVSEPMRRQLVALGAPPDRVVVNPCSVDPGAFSAHDPAAAPPVFVAVGRFVEKKAPHLLLLAFAEVRRRCPEARLRMIGDGRLFGVAEDLVGALGLEDAVELLGAQPHARVQEVLREARAFVQHSVTAASGDSEGMPVSILEAGASGLPVVATLHAGIPDAVVDGETGLLVPERDVAAMAEGMLRLATDPSLAARLGAAARARIAERYSHAYRTDRLWRVLDAARQRQPIPPELLRGGG